MIRRRTYKWGWLYWFKKYRGDRDLDSLNQQLLKVKPEWHRLNTHLD